jgi:hypothetical protein
VLDKPSTEPKHYEFLAADTNDRRREFITSLCAVMGESGNIVRYNQAFESQRLKVLRECFPGNEERTSPSNYSLSTQ